MARKKDLANIEYCGYRPNTKIDVLHYRDGLSYWVSGYQVYDPLKEIDTAKGLAVRVLKRTVLNRLDSHIPVVNGDGSGRAVAIHKDRIRPHKKGDSLTFREVFGSIHEGGIILKGITIDTEKEDLTLGLDNPSSEIEDD